MPSWLLPVLNRIHELAAARAVMFTLKARHELAQLDLGLDEDDACDVLERLTAADFTERLQSVVAEEWLYVFKPRLAETELYVKIILRGHCILVSFHEDRGDDTKDRS